MGGEASADGDGSLHAAEERRAVDDHPIPLLLPRLLRVLLRLSFAVGIGVSYRGGKRGFLLGRLLAFPQDVRNPRPDRSRLHPAAIGEGRVVGGRRAEMPLPVGGIEALSVPARGFDPVR